MSWIKNQFNKLFKMDEQEDYDEYYDEIEQQPVATPKKQRQQDVFEQPQQPKKTFRFPLIEDEYAEPQKNFDPYEQRSESQTTSFYDEDKEKLSLPNYLQKSAAKEVYDVEVSGIRDLLERRRKGKGHSNVIRTPEPVRKVHVSKEERAVLTKSPKREDSNLNKEFVNPLANRKRFVPTEVPSPVHGFLKPTPIEKLIEKQQHIHENLEPKQINALEAEPVTEALEEVAATINTEKEIAEQVEATTVLEPVETQQVQEIIDVPQQAIDQQINAVETVEEPNALLDQELTIIEDLPTVGAMTGVEKQPAILLEAEENHKQEDASVEEVLNDVQVKHVTIENSTIHIGQLNVEQLPQQEQENIEQQIPQLTAQQNTGSRLPFNVLMLKSDKQKMKTRQFVEQQLHQQQTAQQLDVEEPLQELVKQEEVVDSNEAIIEELPSNVQEEPIEKNETELLKESLIIIESQEKQSMEQITEEQLDVVQELKPQEIVEQHPNREAPVVVVPASNSPELVNEREPIQSTTSVALLERENNTQPIVQKVHETTQEVDVERLDEGPVEEEPVTKESAVDNEAVQELPIDDQTVEMEEPPKQKRVPYVKPPLEYLIPPEETVEDRAWMDEQGENLVETLSYFQIQANIESIVQGPAVTQFEITVGQGTKVSKVRNLVDDIKLALAAKDIRIDAPIPGKRSIGIEIPNRISRSVRLSEVTDSESFRNSDSPLEAALGLDLTGKPVTIDLRKMPHGLIAGATGSGKSVCINSILVSLLYKANPNELKLMLIDPKMVELAPFNHIPHLVSPVITDVKAATAALKWAVEEMERRYQLFMHSGARKIEAYNKMCDENGMYAQKLPYLLIVIDELADLMMMSPQDVEDSIVRITQKARAAGIHLIVATQRPSVDVITGLIKSNIPTRVAFSVSSQIDSRTILDAQGAERLLGRGDMLYLGNGMSAPTRIQGTFVTDDEIEEIIEYVREQGEPEYIFKQEELLKRSEAVEEQDELFEEVCRFVFEQGSASTSLLQRRYHIGYNRAARLIDMLERQGYVSEPKGSKPRDVFITEEDLSVQFGD